MSNLEKFQIACTWEVLARKLGNVHPQASFSNTTAQHFLLSAIVSGPPLCDTGTASVGERIERAVNATVQFVGQNTNLGILLLLGPLVCCEPKALRTEELPRVLRRLTVRDAECVYRAIRMAKPGGLGQAAEQDVARTPTVTLLEAMRLSASRDMIARQYAVDYATIFDFGLPALLHGFDEFGCVEAAILYCQLMWLAEYSDSLIQRKCGEAVAADVQHRARDVLNLGGLATAAGRAAAKQLDTFLRSDGHRLNPGTTADLIVACLFIALAEAKLTGQSAFDWLAPDW